MEMMNMTHPLDLTMALQKIQDEIIAFIQEHTENGLNDDLAYALRNAVTELNQAKLIITDRALADGTLNYSDSSEGRHLQEPTPDEANAS
jgi:hypothetical protein